MGDKSKIEWTDATWNPIRGCSRVSEGCRHCYAERVAARFSGPGQAYEGLAQLVTIGKGTPYERSEAHWTGKIALVEEHLADPLKWRTPRLIFVNSMSDLFHDDVPDAWIAKILGIMAMAHRHTFQVLTKRPERMARFLSSLGVTPAEVAEKICELAAGAEGYDGFGDEAEAHIFNALTGALGVTAEHDWNVYWPLRHVHWGVSVEDQKSANARIPHLVQTPAAVLWISLEPMLGGVELTNLNVPEFGTALGLDALRGKYIHRDDNYVTTNSLGKLAWVVVGGESGPGARPMHPDWARRVRDDCAAAKVPFFFKQWGEWGVERAHGIRTKGCDGRLMEFQTISSTNRKDIGKITYYAFPPICDGSHGPIDTLVQMGKREAGRLLDGVLHDEYPALQTSAERSSKTASPLSSQP